MYGYVCDGRKEGVVENEFFTFEYYFREKFLIWFHL